MITVVFNHNAIDASFFKPNQKLILKKEVDNVYDDEAIAVYSTKGLKYGYVANSVKTVVRGTHSAGYIHSHFDQEAECIVKFISDGFAIAEMAY